MGDLEGAIDFAGEAASIGRRLGDSDLMALALHQQGVILLQAGRVTGGAGPARRGHGHPECREVTAMATGIVYCGAIAGCWRSTSCAGRRSGPRR